MNRGRTQRWYIFQALFVGLVFLWVIISILTTVSFMDGRPNYSRNLLWRTGNEMRELEKNMIESVDKRETEDSMAQTKIAVWKQFLDGITLDEMYSRSSPYIEDLLTYMNQAKIVRTTAFTSGTQFKFLLKFEDGTEVIAKPMRHPRNFYWAYNETQPFWLDEERHASEIASFHLDRILNFRKVIPCVGRKVNFTKELIQTTKDPLILGTLKTINRNKCIIGYCPPWFCNDEHPICETEGFMELSLCFKIPGNFHLTDHIWSQGIPEAKIWKSKNVCKLELEKEENSKERYFLDTMEVALFDHLIINYDRHHHMRYERFNWNKSFAVIIDNGKGFGNPFKDDVTFLAPVYQCCRFRNSSYQHILSLRDRLGDLLRASLLSDPLAPILTEPFFEALDRRLNKFYFVMEKCLEAFNPKVVLAEKLLPT